MIPACFLISVYVLSATVFDVQSVPVAEPAPRVFYAQGDAQSNAVVCALSGSTLVMYARSGDAKTLTLPEGVWAFDVAPLEKGAAPVIVCLRGRQVFSIALSDAASQRIEPTLLFEIENPIVGASESPFPHVLVVTANGQRGIAAPTRNGEEFRSPSGDLLASYPSASGVSRSEGNMRVYASPRLVTPLSSGSLAYRVVDVGPVGSGFPENPTAPRSGDGYHASIHEREFPLSRTDSGLRVAFDYHAQTWDTLLRMPAVPPKAEAQSSGEGEQDERKGPARRYPGTLMVDPGYSPDFNGDGFTDLLMWSAPKPGISIDSLLRTAVANTWTVRITMHLYSAEKKRYEPGPAASFALQIPVFWFVDVGKGHPFPLWLVRDFDGDGKTDVLLPTSDSELSVWLAEDGFSGAPSDRLTFLEPVQDIVVSSETDAQGRTGLVIQGRDRLFILWPKEQK